MKFSSMDALEAVILITSGAATHENLIKLMMFSSFSENNLW